MRWVGVKDMGIVTIGVYGWNGIYEMMVSTSLFGLWAKVRMGVRYGGIQERSVKGR